MHGSVGLASLEMDVALAVASRREIQGEQIVRSVKKLRALTEQYDIVLIDTPPSAGSALTAILVRLSDYLITPVSPTFFSLQAIDNLRTIFEGWNRELSWLSGLDDRVKFLGVVVQMAKRFSGGANTSSFSQATESWTELLNKRVQPFQQWMLGTGKSITQEEFARIFPGASPFVIEKCCDFTAQLRGIAERAGVPVIKLTQELCNQHKPKNTNVDITKEDGQYTLSFQHISEQYNNIAKNLSGFD